MSDTSEHLTPNSEESLEVEYQLRITEEINDQKEKTRDEELLELARLWIRSQYKDNVPGLWWFEQEGMKREAVRRAEEKKKRLEASLQKQEETVEENEKQT